jgi:hypothetical protein
MESVPAVRSKLFPTVVANKLGQWLSSNRVLNRFQVGFIIKQEDD